MGETIRGIDARPRTGELDAFTATTGLAANSVAWTYLMPRNSAFAIPVGQTASPVAGWADVPAGTDFNPVVDRIRLFNSNHENARLNPFNGALAGNDADLTPATITLVAGAYDRNVDGATATTLFGIDRNDSELVRVGGVDGVPSERRCRDAGRPARCHAQRRQRRGLRHRRRRNRVRCDDGQRRADASIPARPGVRRGGRPDRKRRDRGALARRGPVATPRPGRSGRSGRPGGPQGAPGSPVFRLVAALATDRYRGRAKKRLAVRFVTTVPALVTLELLRGSRVVAKVADQVAAGRARLAFSRLPKRGRYKLRLTAVAGADTATDGARVRVRR